MFELFGIWINIVSAVLFIAGMVFLLIEMFLPGFGIFGGLGIVSLVLCVVFQAKSLEEALIMVLVLTAIVVLLGLIIARSFKKGALFKSSIVLKNTADKKEGYVSNADFSDLLGKKGKSVTVLRPAGMAEFDGLRVDVVTDGEFIQPGTEVEVFEVAGRRVGVRAAKKASEDKSADISNGPEGTLDM